MFKQAITIPLSSFVLQTLVHKSKPPEAPLEPEGNTQKIHRESPRLKAKRNSGKSITRLRESLPCL
jgi:hypothetical protein